MNTIEALKIDIESLRAQIEVVEQGPLVALTAELQEAENQLSEARSTTAQLAQSHADIVAQDPHIAKLDAQLVRLKADETSISKMSARIMASIGTKPLALGADEGQAIGDCKGQGSLIEQYNAIKDCDQRTAFYAKNFTKL